MSSVALVTSQKECAIPIVETSKSKIFTFLIASYLTDPVCKGHEFFRRFQVVDDLNPEAWKVSNWTRKTFLLAGFGIASPIAVITTLLGIAIRYVICKENSVEYLRGEAPEKELAKGIFSHYLLNACGIGAGYAISDGGVVPWPFRFERLVDNVKRQDADVVCLYEIFDIKMALQLYERLKTKYAHFYFHMNPKAMGVSSGLFVASKFKVENAEFEAFSQDELIGRTKNAGKGFFAFDLCSQGTSFARIFSTHLQQSEELAAPTNKEEKAKREEEKNARDAEMARIMAKATLVKNKAVFFTGDFNWDDQEFSRSRWRDLFDKVTFDLTQEWTWGGDTFCAQLTGKKASLPLNIDHAMLMKGTAKKITTNIIDMRYDATKYTDKALSDHNGLLSQIYLN